MCYISMNREDGRASAEVVHESLPHEVMVTEYQNINSSNCPRCSQLDMQLNEECFSSVIKL